MTFGNDTTYYIIKALLVIFATLCMMASCTNIKASIKKIAVIITLYFIWVVAVSFFILVFFDFLILLRLSIPLISIPAMIALYYLSECSQWQAVFSYTMQLSISLMLAVTQTLIVTMLNGGKISDFIIRLVSYSLLIAAEWRFLRKEFVKLNYLHDKSWRSLSIVPMGFLVLLFIIATYPVHYFEHSESIIYLYAVAVIMIIVYFILFHSLIDQYNLQLSEHTNKILVSQVQAVQKHFDTIIETEQQLKIQRHDMRFYLATIAEMLKNNDILGALDLINGVDKKLNESRTQTYCSNGTINAVLSYYINKARENEIKTEIDFFLPENFTIDITDFTAMMANALENSINACKKIENPILRKLRIKTMCKVQYIIEIDNTFNDEVSFDESGLPITQEEGHGIGTHSIAVFAQRNGALLDYDVDGDWFKLRIAAKL